jgi:hypothetical protein
MLDPSRECGRGPKSITVVSSQKNSGSSVEPNTRYILPKDGPVVPAEDSVVPMKSIMGEAPGLAIL